MNLHLRYFQSLSNGTTFYVVSFFLLLASWILFPSAMHVAAADDPAWEQSLRDASDEQWQSLVGRTASALTGLPTDEAMQRRLIQDAAREQRPALFREAVRVWTAGEDFVNAQKRSWLRDHGALEDESPASTDSWNFDLHDRWIANAIRDQLPYDEFVRRQLAGDDTGIPSPHRIATAIWFRSGRSRDIEFNHSTHGFSRLPPDPKGVTIRNVDWLIWNESAIVTQKLNAMEHALQSIQRSETLDFDRLRNDPSISDWHAKQAKFPSPESSELSFDYSPLSAPSQPSSGHAAGLHVLPIDSPLSRTREWSVVMELRPGPKSMEADEDLCILVRQRDSESDASLGNRQWVAGFYKGRFRVSMIHLDPTSAILVESIAELDRTRTHQIAVVYDGMQSAESIRIWIDGSFAPCTIRHDTLVKDFVSERPQVLEVRNRLAGAEDWSVEDLQAFRTALSEAELIGIDQDQEWKLWDACDAEEKRMWVEHFAKRIDPQWRYQRESFLFYAANYAAILESLAVMPVLSPSARVRFIERHVQATAAARFPESLFKFDAPSDVSVDWSDRRTLASLVATRFAASLARAEVVRQWRSMLIAASLNESTALDDAILNERIEQFIESGWSRRQLLQDLVLSKSWADIAIDSNP